MGVRNEPVLGIHAKGNHMGIADRGHSVTYSVLTAPANEGPQLCRLILRAQ